MTDKETQALAGAASLLNAELCVFSSINERISKILLKTSFLKENEIHPKGGYKNKEQVEIAMIYEANKHGLAFEVFAEYQKFVGDKNNEIVDYYLSHAKDAMYEWDI